jgi:hypothetical protein
VLGNTGSGAKAGALDGAVLDTDFSGLPAVAIIRFVSGDMEDPGAALNCPTIRTRRGTAAA